jgi:hypothetical protein
MKLLKDVKLLYKWYIRSQYLLYSIREMTLTDIFEMLQNKPLKLFENKADDSLAKMQSRTAPFLNYILDEHRLHDKGVVPWQLSSTRTAFCEK